VLGLGLGFASGGHQEATPETDRVLNGHRG